MSSESISLPSCIIDLPKRVNGMRVENGERKNIGLEVQVDMTFNKKEGLRIFSPLRVSLISSRSRGKEAGTRLKFRGF